MPNNTWVAVGRQATLVTSVGTPDESGRVVPAPALVSATDATDVVTGVAGVESATTGSCARTGTAILAPPAIVAGRNSIATTTVVQEIGRASCRERV